MPLAAFALAAITATLLLTLAWIRWRCWQKRQTLPVDYIVAERLVTGDGAAIELYRLPSAESPGSEPCPGRLPPVLLAHGLGANHRVWDVSRELSLARHLSHEGRDVWLVTLRSSLTRLGVPARHCRFSNLARFDLPLAVDTIRERTGQARVDFVGYSVGGMLLYAALGRSLAVDKIRRAVLLAAPAWVGVPFPGVPRWLHLGLARLLPALWLTRIAAGASLLPEWVRHRLFGSLANAHDVSLEVVDRALANVASVIPTPLLRDLSPGRASQLSWPERGGQPLLEGLGPLSVPALFIAGAGDRAASAAAVEAAYRARGADTHVSHQRFLLVGGGPQALPRTDTRICSWGAESAKPSISRWERFSVRARIRLEVLLQTA